MVAIDTLLNLSLACEQELLLLCLNCLGLHAHLLWREALACESLLRNG